MDSLLQDLLAWISAHPHLSGLVIFWIALLESLVVIGLLIPGAFLLFGVGALIATGNLPLVPILLWTIAGAIAGDGISFLLGHHYHEHLRVIWPLRRYPVLVNRGIDFFYQHGGKSVFMARFVGPVRPIIPAIAGMMNMSVARFLLVDIVAAILWAPAYILPGMVFGASLGLAAEVAGRLVVLLVVVVGIAWLSIWLIRLLIRLFQPQVAALLEKILVWSRNHPLIRPLAGSLLDPNHPEARGLAMLSVLFFLALWLLLLVSRQVLHGKFMANLDRYLQHSFDNLRTPWADYAMVFITQLGGQGLLAIVLLGGCAWLLWKGYAKAASHWLAVYVCAGIFTWVLKVSAQIQRPSPLIDGHSFPSAHTSMSLVVYGFLALIIARELPFQRRWIPYSTATLVVLAIAFSRLYLGAHWYSDVLAGISLGICWVALIGIAYDRHPAPAVPVKKLLVVMAVVLVFATSWQVERRFTGDLAYYEPRIQIQETSLAEWAASGWQAIPVFRIDLEGADTQPLNFQWAGTLQYLQTLLEQHGWRPAPVPGPLGALNWLAPDPDITQLPVLPHVHDGEHQSLLLVGPSEAAWEQLVVIRLWPANIRITDSGTPLWVGNVSFLYLDQTLPLITFLRTTANFESPLLYLQTVLARTDEAKLAQRTRTAPARQAQWNGQVLLAWESAGSEPLGKGVKGTDLFIPPGHIQ